MESVTLNDVFLFAVLAICAYTDCRFRTISNWVTYPSCLGFLAINILASLQPGLESTNRVGAIGIENSLLGGLICFVTTFVLWSLKGLGGGDLKLATVIGFSAGVPNALIILMLGLIVASMFFLARNFWIYGNAASAGKGHDDSSTVQQSSNESESRSTAVQATSVPLGFFSVIGYLLFLLMA